MTADEIKALRARLNLSHAAFGEHFGVSERTVYAWEQGTRSPSKAAAKLLGQLAARAKKSITKKGAGR